MEFVVFDEDVPRLDRLEFTHVAPVAVKGCEVLTIEQDDDEVDRVEIAEEFVDPAFLVDEFDERVLFGRVSDIVDSRN